MLAAGGLPRREGLPRPPRRRWCVRGRVAAACQARATCLPVSVRVQVWLHDHQRLRTTSPSFACRRFSALLLVLISSRIATSRPPKRQARDNTTRLETKGPRHCSISSIRSLFPVPLDDGSVQCPTVNRNYRVAQAFMLPPPRFESLSSSFPLLFQAFSQIVSKSRLLSTASNDVCTQ